MDQELKDYLQSVVDEGLEKNYWFMTKQTMTDFYFIFEIAQVVETYPIKKKPNENFGAYYARFFDEDAYLKQTYPAQSASENTYRNAIISEFFGLFSRTKTGYDSGVVTPAYNLFKHYIQNHNDVETYRFLIERQIEKLCLNVNDKIQNYTDLDQVKIFPVMLLYKILNELYKRTGDSTLYYDEFVAFLVRTRKYEDWEKTLNLILSFRTNGLDASAKANYDSIVNDVTAQNIRFDTLFGTLSNLEYPKRQKRNYYKIKDSFESHRYIENAIEIFEASKYSLSSTTRAEMFDFLKSDKYFIGNLDVAFKAKVKEDPKVETDLFTPEWFKEKGKEFADLDIQAADLYADFKSKFEPSKLAALSNEDLLNTLFLGGNTDNMCHELEYVKTNTQLFGSIKNGTAFKYPLFKSNGTWMTGSSRHQIQLSLSEAIIKGTAVRDALVRGAEIISAALPLNTVEDYLALYTSLYAEIPDVIDSMWAIKYYHMIFPDLIPTFYNKDWQLKVLSVLKINPSDATFGRLGQINIFVKECEISNVVFAQVFHKYCRNYEVVEEDDDVEEVIGERLKCGQNIILYGVPGAGKSWTIKHEYCDDDDRMERLVFHPDYTYSDFVGQILPKVNEDTTVSYEFTPGPFTNLVKKAYLNPEKEYFLIIEEVNRGNAPAIFGDIFQLLDRNKDGSSEYEITNSDIAKVVYGNKNHKVSIPSNMSILCTMNTSDQNVFTLDTAFQRRWSMRLIKNKFRDEETEKTFAGTKILDTDVTWEHFFTSINKIILSKNIRMTSSEDKRLGTHFVSDEDLKYVEGDEKQNSRFPEKVLKYLWDDAFKFTKEDIFDLDKVQSLEDVIEIFVGSTKNDRLKVFKENIYNTLVKKNNENA